MIKKIFRLKEKDLKKVLLKGKPFFSYGIVLNLYKNKLDFNRFGIVISGKSVKNNINRNYFRRMFYEKIRGKEDIKKENNNFDFVFVIKKQNILDKQNILIVDNFKKDIDFLTKKVIF